MYKLITNSKMPKILKVLLVILLTLTCIYWIGFMLYKILDTIRIVLHWCTDKRNWWTFLVCILILLLGSFLIAQFALGLDPLGQFIEWIKSVIASIKTMIGFMFI